MPYHTVYDLGAMFGGLQDHDPSVIIHTGTVTTQFFLIDEEITYKCAVAPGPISAITSSPDAKISITRFIQHTGLWTIKGKADFEFVDGTGKVIFEWHS